jgi:hypothetical protein
MALLSFRGFDTPSLPAQGEQRRSTYFNIGRDIPRPWRGQLAVMSIRDQIRATREWEATGEAVRTARKARDAIGTRPAEEVKRLRQAANETAAYCADCFEPLAPGQSATLVCRFLETVPEFTNPISGWVTSAWDRKIDVPICLPCWLVDLAKPPPWRNLFRGFRQDGRQDSPIAPQDRLRRCRCEGCGRPLRFVATVGGPGNWLVAHWRLRDRCCCEDCFRKATLHRANERRRVRHRQIACVVCKTMFVPTKSTAKTCGNRCRQALFRQNHRTP